MTFIKEAVFGVVTLAAFIGGTLAGGLDPRPSVFHDSTREVTCWTRRDGLQCLPDHYLGFCKSLVKRPLENVDAGAMTESADLTDYEVVIDAGVTNEE